MIDIQVHGGSTLFVAVHRIYRIPEGQKRQIA